MKIGVIKTMNLVIICAALFCYQQQASARAAEVEAYEEEKAAAKQAWAQARAAEGAAMEADQETAGYADGVYEGTGTGFGGDVVVSVTITEGKIADVQVVSGENETPEYLEGATALLDDIVKVQSTDVDTVSGATLSSNGILEGTKEALSLAEGGAS